ncbi:hypothetical protein QJQ45_003057 [Haematococcus lacustris]|nr:hypothetical protein QJQ45_003057 [Haematococcus lacustris]
MLSLSHTRPSLQEVVDSEWAAGSSEGEEAHRRPGSAGKRKKKARRSAASAPKASDPAAEALRSLQQVVPGLNCQAAKEALEAVVEQRPELKIDVAMWVDEAQIHLACFQEIDAEAQVMRAAMQQSLADAELSHKKAKEEELREGRLPGVQRRYSESPIFQQLCRVACPHLLVSPFMHPPLTKLLALEKRCKQWYSGRGTYVFFDSLAAQLAQLLASSSPSNASALEPGPGSRGRQPGTAPHSPPPIACDSPCCSCCANQAKTQTQSQAEAGATGQAVPAQPPLGQAAGTRESQAAGGSAVTGSGSGQLDGTQAGSVPGGGQGGSGAQPSEGTAAAADYPARSRSPRQCHAVLCRANPTLQVEVINQDITRMPAADKPTAAAVTAVGAAEPGGVRRGATAPRHRQSGPCKDRVEVAQVMYIPPLFRLPAGEQEMEVVDCWSDED